MSVDFEAPNMVTMSPRYSFSHDIIQMETIQGVRSGSSSSSVDFDFCVSREGSSQEQSSSADELFSGGKILPIEIKRRLLHSPSKKKQNQPFQELPPSPLVDQAHQETIPKKASSGEMKRVVSESYEKQNSSKSFWGFKRSSSLNGGSGYARTLCPLPLLSRSKSAGSSTSAKRSSATCNNSEKFVGMKGSHSSGTTGNHQKPPLKKKYGSHHGQGMKFSPVLNVPSASLFGLGFMFSSSKERSKKI